jgi:hypothetical protein
MRRARLLAAGVGLASSVVELGLPLAGGYVRFSRGISMSASEWNLLGQQLIGPLCTLLVALVMLVSVQKNRKVFRWLAIPGILGAAYTMWAARENQGIFSQALFRDCGPLYGDVIVILGALTGLALAIGCFPVGQASTFRDP